jgi:hypothetical protein
VQERAQAVDALAMAQGFRFFQGQTTSGLAQMQQGLAVTEATGGYKYMVLTLLLVAEAYALDDQAEAGLEVLWPSPARDHARR